MPSMCQKIFKDSCSGPTGTREVANLYCYRLHASGKKTNASASDQRKPLCGHHKKKAALAHNADVPWRPTSGESVASIPHSRAIKALLGGCGLGDSSLAVMTPKTPQPAIRPFRDGHWAAAHNVSKIATLNSLISIVNASANATINPPLPLTDWPMATEMNASRPSLAAKASAPCRSSHSLAHQPAASASSCGNLSLQQRATCKFCKYIVNKKEGPDNPTSQLLPIMSNKYCSGDGEGRKNKGGGGGKMVCDKVVCVCERWCGERWCVCERWSVTCVKDGV